MNMSRVKIFVQTKIATYTKPNSFTLTTPVFVTFAAVKLFTRISGGGKVFSTC
jgi:hypothetical protein